MKKTDAIAIVLAAGQGKRMGLANQNKTTLVLNGKPMIRIGVEKLLSVCERVIVVVGNEAESVFQALSGLEGIYYAIQTKRLGTGHAVKIACEQYDSILTKAKNIIVAMGDHFAFYEVDDYVQLIDLRMQLSGAIALATTIDTQANQHGYGRIIRGENGNVQAIIEQKNCTPEQLNITEINPALYAFDAQFLLGNIAKIQINTLSGEFYITDLVEIANKQNLQVVPLSIDPSHVGVGINTPKDLEEAQRLFQSTKKL